MQNRLAPAREVCMSMTRIRQSFIISTVVKDAGGGGGMGEVDSGHAVFL